MANEEQIALLKQGSEVWNKWRKENPDVEIELEDVRLFSRPLLGPTSSRIDLSGADLCVANLRNADLSGADLSRADLGDAHLSGANLSDANLSGADLSRADLSGADLDRADLSRADLSSTYLSGANLFAADLRNADLSSADLSGANLGGVGLSGANLSGADLGGINLRRAGLSGAVLRGFDLRGTDLSGADLSDADLSGADLSRADLSSADLSGANLNGADLSGANLNGAGLSGADLRGAGLSGAQILRTDFTEATLTGAYIADWLIGSSTILEGVKCDYIFRTYDEENEQFGRLPVDPDSIFAPGEFTKLFQILESAYATIPITFSEGIDWQAFFRSFQTLRDSHPDKDISIQGLERKGNAFVVCLEVATEADKGKIETEVKQLYAHQLAALEAQYEQRLQLQGAQLEDAQRTIKVERQRNTELIGVIGIVAQNQEAKYDMRGAQFAGGFAETVQGDQYGGVINNYGQDADDIVALLTALRTWSQALPEAQQDDVLMELDALEADLNKPEQPEPKRLGKRLQRLIAAGMAAAEIASQAVTFSGNVNEFTDNVLELGEKIGLTREDIQAQP